MDGDGQHIKHQIDSAFGDDYESLYTIIGVSPTATEDEIKRSYRRLALKYHPDRGGEAEKFKALSAIHSILTDVDKRKVYDETGELDGVGDQMMSDESFEFWDNYFRSMFPKVTVEDIVSFSQMYKGSTGDANSDYNERQDIIDAYNQHEGRFDHIMESVILAEEEDEDRITGIIKSAISTGEIEATRAFEKHLQSLTKKQKKKKRISSTTNSEEIHAQSTKNTKKNKRDGNMDDLAAMILGNKTNRQNNMSSIFSRYGVEGNEKVGEYENISEAEFERTRAKLNKKSGSSKRKKRNKHKNFIQQVI